MLGRKQSLREASFVPEVEELIRATTSWWESVSMRRFMRFCALLSLVSVSLNTSHTFEGAPVLLYITFVIDIFVTLVFTAEFISKVHTRGLKVYTHDRWSQFDAIMLFCLYISLVLHIFEITGHVEPYSPTSMLRAPRPLIMVRLVRVFLSFSMPRARITQIFLRSSQQIYNVTLFFLFFLSLFGLLGVQFFSRLDHHCVMKGNYSDDYLPAIQHLAIPDTYCSPIESRGHQCPPKMVCVEISNSSGYQGFDNLLHALFTVYQSASQEGWSHVMYAAMDSLDSIPSFLLLRHTHLLPRMARQECLHCRHHRDVQRNKSPVSADVGREGANHNRGHAINLSGRKPVASHTSDRIGNRVTSASAH